MTLTCRLSLFLALIGCAWSPPDAWAQSQVKSKLKADLLSNIDDATRQRLAELPEGVQKYIAYRLTGGSMKGLLYAESPESWQTGEIGIISYGPRNLAPEKQVFELSDIVDERNAIIQDHKVWVEGLGTGSIVDGQPISLAGQFFVVAGNKTYRTAIGGSRTVKHVVAVNTREINGLLSQIAEPQGYRVWVDQHGYSEIAQFKKRSGGSVSVINLMGKTSTLPLKRLSEADRQWVEANSREASEGKQ